MGLSFISPQISIDKNILVVLFIQTVPGSEEEICKELSLHLALNEPQLFFSFSEFDIIAFARLNHESELNHIRSFAHPKIRDFQQVICYQSSAEGRSLVLSSALTITLFKFDEYEINQKGLGIEVVASDLVKPTKLALKKFNAQGYLLSTLGWPESIFIQSGNNLQVLLSNITNVAINSQTFGNLQISHTFPCIRRGVNEKLSGLSFDHVDGLLDDWKIAVSCLPFEINNLQDKINTKFKSDGGQPILEIDAVFGRRDLTIKPSKTLDSEHLNISFLISVLKYLRSELADEIISTHTDIGVPITSTFGDSKHLQDQKIKMYNENRDQRLKEEFHTLQINLREFKRWEADRDNLTLAQTSQIIQMVMRLQAIAATPGLASVVDDMLEFSKAAVRKAVSQIKRVEPIMVSKQNRITYYELEDMENVYLFGLEQRMVGARLGLGHPSQAYSNIQGLGIQRILRASGTVVRGLLRGINLDIANNWWGFTVFGFRNDTFTLPSGVINLPYQDMLRPEDWWRLGHESGHAFGMITNLLDNPIITEYLEQIDKKNLRDILKQEISPIVDEMAVSVFEYLFCYRGNYELYLRTTWRFFDHLLEGVQKQEKLMEYLLRSVFVYFFHLEINQIIKQREDVEGIINRGKKQTTLFNDEPTKTLKERAFGEEGSTEIIITNSIMKDIFSVVKKINYSLLQVNLLEVVEAYKILEPLRSNLTDLFEKYLRQESLSQKNSSQAEYKKKSIDSLHQIIQPNLEKKLLEYSKAFNAGKILTKFDSDLDVFLVPLALQYWKYEMGGNISEQARIAAILSLWHLDRNWRKEN